MKSKMNEIIFFTTKIVVDRRKNIQNYPIWRSRKATEGRTDQNALERRRQLSIRKPICQQGQLSFTAKGKAASDRL